MTVQGPVKEQQPDGLSHGGGGGGVGGGSEAKKKVCGPKIGPKLPAPLITFIFLPESMTGGGWGWPGPQTPPLPPLSGGSLSNGLA